MLIFNGTPLSTLGRPNPLAGSASVSTLQTALLNLAMVTGRPAISPGVASGTVDTATMASIAAASGLITAELPSWLAIAMEVAMVAGSGTTTAKKFVEDHATEFTIAVNTAAAKYKATGIIPTVLPTTTPGLWDTIFPVGWYSMPSLGWLVVLGAGFGAYKLLKGPAKAA